MTLSCIRWWGSTSGPVIKEEYPFTAITPTSNLTRVGSYCSDLISGSSRSIWKSFLFKRTTWKNSLKEQQYKILNLKFYALNNSRWFDMPLKSINESIYSIRFRIRKQTRVKAILWNLPTFLSTKWNLPRLWIKFATLVEGDQKAPFSIATTLRCRGGRYSFPWIAPIYPCYVPYITECLTRRYQVPFLKSLVWSPGPLANILPTSPMSQNCLWNLYRCQDASGGVMVTKLH